MTPRHDPTVLDGDHEGNFSADAEPTGHASAPKNFVTVPHSCDVRASRNAG